MGVRSGRYGKEVMDFNDKNDVFHHVHDLKSAFRALHINYINYCEHITKHSYDNFWGIENFMDYLLTFSGRFADTAELSDKALLDMARHFGYDVEK
jgi:hypothetical protein